ncbi:DNA primase [Haloparvum sp. AD34]
MDPLHARYPFFQDAREAVAEADVSLPALVAADAPAVERGRERVERALMEGTVASESPEEYDASAELLSYPIARILVSLLDSTAAVEKYATAEAATAAERFAEDFERDDELQSVSTPSVDFEDVLAEFDLSDAVRAEAVSGAREPDWYWLRVGPYLELASADWGERWRLVNRELAAGEVRIPRADLFRVLEAAVRSRVLEGLPFELEEDEGLAAELESQVADLKRLLSERTRVGQIDVVVPELFPPCMVNLIEKAERGTALSHPESFALMAFLTGIGMEPDEVVAFCADTSLDAEGIRYQTEYLRDDRGTQYPPPTCETLSAYGICHNEEEHWKVAADPLAYYETRLEDAGDDVVGWRERAAE